MVSFCSPEDVGLFSESSDAPRAEALIELVSEAFVATTGTSFEERRGEQMLLDATGSRLLRLPLRPSDVALVEVRQSRGIFEAVEVQWSHTGLLHRLDGGVFPWGYRNVRVTLSHGSATVPADVRSGVAKEVARLMAAAPGVESWSLGDYSEKFSSGVSEEWSRLLRKYGGR